MTPAPLFEKLLEAGRLGEKSGSGFYDHPGGESEEVHQMMQDLQTSGEVALGTSFSVERLMYPLINEAAQCLLENVATMTDIDMAMVAGTGMTYEGDRVGPLVIADRIGLDEIVDELWELEEAFGPRFRPARPLRLRVRAGHLGVKTGKGFYEHT
jgi:3-hydroxyacyl-CoA dehydrogenase